MARILKVPIYRQKPSFCGPASLRMIFAYNGVRAQVKDGSSLIDIKGCLRRGIPAIVNWFSVDDGHYSVVTGMDRKYIYINDPDKARKRKMRISRFLTVGSTLRRGRSLARRA